MLILTQYLRVSKKRGLTDRHSGGQQKVSLFLFRPKQPSNPKKQQIRGGLARASFLKYDFDGSLELMPDV